MVNLGKFVLNKKVITYIAAKDFKSGFVIIASIKKTFHNKSIQTYE